MQKQRRHSRSRHPVAAVSLVVTALAWLGPATASSQQRRAIPQALSAGLTVFDHIDYEGESMLVRNDVADFQTTTMNDRISSLRIAPGELWEVCEHTNYQGRCAVVTGAESDLRRGNWNDIISSARRVERLPAVQTAGAAAPGLELFTGARFTGDRRAFDGEQADLRQVDFNDAAQSIRVAPGQAWEVCQHAGFENCVTIDASVDDLRRTRLAGQISSVRPVPRPEAIRTELVLYDDRNFRGRSVRLTADAFTLDQMEGAESVQVSGGAWQLCEAASFAGRCLVVSEHVPDLYALGFRNGIRSARRIAGRR